MYHDPLPAPFLARYRWPLALAAAVLFTLLLVDELAFGDEPFTPRALLFELIDLGLLIGCTVAAALLALQGRARAKQDVALLLLKGFSHKEIARLRETGEATIRQQAGAIHAKADVGGRAGLAAYFLDGLHLPKPDAAENRPRVTSGSGPGPV